MDIAQAIRLANEHERDGTASNAEPKAMPWYEYDDGVPLCTTTCGAFVLDATSGDHRCWLTKNMCGEELACIPAVRDMARELREARAQIDRDNANAYAEAVLATMEAGEV